jgi:pimeloyl-ACP methyl ester carboxylesterase
MTGLVLSYRAFPTGAPVLLIHGFASSGAADWVGPGWPAALAGIGRGAWVADLPGHGGGLPAARGSAPTSAVVAALADVARAASPEPIDVVGYSVGARLAYDLAATGVVRRLVLGGLGAGDPFAGVDGDALAQAVAGAPVDDPRLGWMAQWISAPGLDTPSLVALIEGLGSEPFQPAARPPQVPTLFLSGAADGLGEGIEEIVALVPGAQFGHVPGDHEAALHSPEFRAAVLAFLAA